MLICKVNNAMDICKTEPQYFHFDKTLFVRRFHFMKKAIKWIKYGPATLIIATRFFSSS